MAAYLIRRGVHSVLVLVGLTVVVFFVARILGDPVRLMLPIDAPEAQVEAIRKSVGLDQPVAVQFVRFVSDVARGDFGKSLRQNVPALPLVLERLPATMLLVAGTMSLAILIAIPLGALSATRPGSIADRLSTVFSLAGVCVAEFWLALMLILVFALDLGWFLTSGYGDWKNLVLPSVTLALRPIGRIAQVVRTSMLDELSKTYIVTARSKGLHERVVVYYHALKNAAIPIITLTGDEIAGLVNGAVVAEVVFGWPGVGLLMIDAIQKRDLPLIQADVFVVAVLVVAINLTVDLTNAYVDPRIRFA
jgi:peptide/nickel transport system permease protein